MPNITTVSKFIDDLFIPLAVNNIATVSSQQTPNNNVALVACITEFEKSLLLNALGTVTYNALQTALANLSAADQKWKDLVNGVDYDGKSWEGLDSDKSFICYRVYSEFLKSNNDFFTAVGNAKPNSENSSNINPTQRYVNAWHKFLKKYQGECKKFPLDFYGYSFNWGSNFTQSEVEVSLFRFLTDKAEDYAFDAGNFRFYESVNQLGL